MADFMFMIRYRKTRSGPVRNIFVAAEDQDDARRKFNKFSGIHKWSILSVWVMVWEAR
jgi:hypothetical protein